MALTGNKGEWSEIYALLKLLGDKEVYAGDADLNKIESLVYPIIKILRTEASKNYEYVVNNNIIIVNESGNKLLEVSIADFTEQAARLLTEIKIATGSSFSIPETEKFMNSVKCQTLKAKSNDKSDIKIVIHDLITNTQPLLGFSIKSKLGNPSTLLNAGRTTNILFNIEGAVIEKENIELINKIDTKSKIRDRIAEINHLGGQLAYFDFENKVFKNNLVLIDSLLPQIVAEIVRLFYSENLTTVKDIVERIEKDNPLNFDSTQAHKFYEYKVKRMLTDIALGMMPASVWTGQYDATGGYLVVKEDGEVLCYHIYNKNEFENYLFSNTKLETPSSTRHGFGIIESNNEQQIFKLNLQIRFK